MEFKLSFISAHTNKPVFHINVFDSLWILSDMAVDDKQLDLTFKLLFILGRCLRVLMCTDKCQNVSWQDFTTVWESIGIILCQTFHMVFLLPIYRHFEQ